MINISAIKGLYRDLSNAYWGINQHLLLILK